MASQSHKSMQSSPKTLGGQKLRELRQSAGISLMDLSVKLGSEDGKLIDTGHINRIETGNIKKPLVETLETILAGLHASYRDRRDVLEAFGYQVPMTLPTEQEVDEAIKLSAYELRDATYPVCLIDHGQRLWAWNRYTPRLVGLHPDNPATARFFGVSMFDLAFNPTFETRIQIVNPADFLPGMLHFAKVDIYAHREQLWYQELIGRASDFPGFRDLWESLPTDTLRSVVPLRANIPAIGMLQFRMSSADLLLDPRFQIMHFTPYGAKTLRTCAEWAEEEGVL